MGIGEKIDINKGKLPYRGRGLENSVNTVSYTHLTLPTTPVV